MAGFADMGMRRVRTAHDWGTVRALRFHGLCGRGDIAASASGAFADPFDDARGSATYLLLAGERPIGTTRTSVGRPLLGETLPAQRVFERELAIAFGRAATLVEASLTFVDPQAARDPQDALMRLFKVHVWRCAAESADALVVAVRESQIGFYRRRFDMEILSGAESFPGLAAPRVLMGLAWRQHAAELLRRIPALAEGCGGEIVGSDPN